MKNIFLPLMVFLLVAACAPRDVPFGSDRSSGLNGKSVSVGPDEVVTVDQQGQIAKTCPGGPYSSMDSPIAWDQQIFDGKITASFTAGDRNCFKIGDIVDIADHVNKGPSRGKVKVTKVEIFAVSKMTEATAKAFNTTLANLQSLVNAELARVKAIPKGSPGGFDPKGMVNITYFEYQNPNGGTSGTNTGANNTGTGNGGTATPAVTDVVEFTEPGALPSTCPATYQPSKSIDIAEQFDGDILSGKLIGFMSAGDRNCFQIGSIISLKAKAANKTDPAPPERAKLQIAWVELVPFDKLSIEQAQIMNMSLEDLKASAQKMISGATNFDAKNMVNITVFNYMPPVAIPTTTTP